MISKSVIPLVSVSDGDLGGPGTDFWLYKARAIQTLLKKLFEIETLNSSSNSLLKG